MSGSNHCFLICIQISLEAGKVFWYSHLFKNFPQFIVIHAVKVYLIKVSLWESDMQVRKQQLELDMEQQTGSKKEKEYIKAVYCHPAYLTYMQSTSWETLG